MKTYNTKTLLQRFAIALTAASLIGCAGSTANPVSSYNPKDKTLSCSSIHLEMSSIDKNVRSLTKSESNRKAANVALGVTGWFLIVPWFFMDLSDAKQVEMTAYRQRYMTLQQLQADNNC